MNSFDKKMLDKLAREQFDLTWKDIKEIKMGTGWQTRELVERAVALARQEMLEKIEEKEQEIDARIDYFEKLIVRFGDNLNSNADREFIGLKAKKEQIIILRSFLQGDEKE